MKSFGVSPARIVGLFSLLCLLILGFHPSAVSAQQQVSQAVQVIKINSPATVLVLGDSLSAAYGIAVQKGWVALLEQRLQKHDSAIRVVNASISGETTSGGLQRLSSLLKQHNPDLLILELGANDALRGQNLLQTKANLQQMISLCRQQTSSCQPVLLGIRLPTNYGPAYERLLMRIYKQLASDNQIGFDPFFLEDVVLEPDMMQQDALHPNEQAQPLILERIWPLIKAYF